MMTCIYLTGRNKQMPKASKLFRISDIQTTTTPLGSYYHTHQIPYKPEIPSGLVNKWPRIVAYFIQLD